MFSILVTSSTHKAKYLIRNTHDQYTSTEPTPTWMSISTRFAAVAYSGDWYTLPLFGKRVWSTFTLERPDCEWICAATPPGTRTLIEAAPASNRTRVLPALAGRVSVVELAPVVRHTSVTLMSVRSISD